MINIDLTNKEWFMLCSILSAKRVEIKDNYILNGLFEKLITNHPNCEKIDSSFIREYNCIWEKQPQLADFAFLNKDKLDSFFSKKIEELKNQ